MKDRYLKEKDRLDRIKYFIIDVDGTMTDAGIYYDDQGNELKKFCTKDAAGFFAAKQAGIKIMVLTGRECQAVTRRMTEMKVDFLYQNVKEKAEFLKNFIEEHKIAKEEIAYLGDDLNDLSGMQLAGFVGCPKDACEEVKAMADYISSEDGGHGAVRDIISYILKKRNEWNDVIEKIYGGI